jgi:hypothetical protein
MARKFSNGIDNNGQKIVNLGDGTAASDAATWGQVQAFLAGLAWKVAVRAASTGNVSLAAPGASMDGVTLAANDRVLLKNQTAGSENGIYVWSAAGTPLVRATDMDSAVETQSATVLVREGTANADTAWTQTADAVTLGTTSLVFVQFASGATVYTAAATGGLQLIASAFSAKLPASSGLITDASGIYIDVAIVVRKFATNYGDGSALTFTITHNLNTRDCQVICFDNTSFLEEYPDVAHTTVNTVTLTYGGTAPAAAAKRCVVQG